MAIHIQRRFSPLSIGMQAMGERGFVYPVTLCILLLFSSFLTIHLNHFVMERRFVQEIELFEKNHFLFLQSLKRLEVILFEEEYTPTGVISYDSGDVHYEINEFGVDLVQVIIKLRLGTETEATAFAYYDTERQKMIKWIERN